MCIPTLVLAANPPKLYKVKKELIYYHNSGHYQRAISAVTHKAMRYTAKRVNRNSASSHPKRLAAVFDIDETSLSNFPSMLKLDFGGTTKAKIRAQDQARDPAILPTLQLFRFEIKNGVTVFL